MGADNNEKKPVYTTSNGCPVHNPSAWQRIGTAPGPVLLQDFHLIDQLAHFDRERIPERVVHARGAGAFGYFKAFDSSASKYTCAKVLTDTSRTTPVFVRFSTVQGSRGSAVSILER